MSKTDNLGSLLELIKKINSTSTNPKDSSFNWTQSKELFEEFEYLHDNIYNNKNFSLNTNDRLESILQILSDMANMDFSGIAQVNENLDHLDYFAFSLNHASDRIGKKVKELNYFKKIVNSFNDSFIITDNKGIINFLSKTIDKGLNIEEENTVGIPIKVFFNSLEIKTKYSIDFVNTCVEHEIEAGYFENKIADTVLRVTSKTCYNEQGLKHGVCYKIEQLDQTIYRKHDSLNTNYIHSVYKEIAQNSKNERKELLLSIASEYCQKTELNCREILILNSINKELQDLNQF